MTEGAAYCILKPGTRPTNGGRVLRGGSWNNDNQDNFRCANRNNNKPTNRNDNNGFRVASTPPPGPGGPRTAGGKDGSPGRSPVRPHPRPGRIEKRGREAGSRGAGDGRPAPLIRAGPGLPLRSEKLSLASYQWSLKVWKIRPSCFENVAPLPPVIHAPARRVCHFSRLMGEPKANGQVFTKQGARHGGSKRF